MYLVLFHHFEKKGSQPWRIHGVYSTVHESREIAEKLTSEGHRTVVARVLACRRPKLIEKYDVEVVDELLFRF